MGASGILNGVTNGRRILLATLALTVIGIVSACGERDDQTTALGSPVGSSGVIADTPGTVTVVDTPTVRDLVDTATVSDVAELPPAAPDPGHMTVDGPVVRHALPYWDHAMLEEVAGVLVLEGDCLYLAPPESQERYPVVWPATTRWDAENQSVVTPAGEVVRIGEAVQGGGGYSNTESVEFFAGVDARVLVESCLDDRTDQVAIVNNNESAIRASNA